ncbi:pheromone-regulated protein prm10 [Rhodotorula kratochvilovae]
MSSNPFEQPYSAEGRPSAHHPPSAAPPPILVHDDTPPSAAESRRADSPARDYTSNSRDHSDETSSATMLNTSQGTHRSAASAGRRVQFPAELPAYKGGDQHVAIEMGAALQPTPSRNLAQPGASAELARALEAAAAADVATDDEDEHDREQRYVGMEGGSRAASSDGDPNERLEELKDHMEVYVDPGERDGLPSTSRRNPEEKNTKAAWNLVRGLTMGGQTSSLRRRRGSEAPAGFSSGTGANAEETKEETDSTKDESRTQGFLHRLKEGNVQDIPPEAGFSSSGIGSGGILSALIALQQQQQGGGGSGSVSGATTPASMGPSSRAGSITDVDLSDDEEEEAQRRKFLAKLHEKRAQKTRLHHLAEGFGSGAQGVAVGVGRGAGAVIGTAGRGAGAVIGTAGRSAGAVIGTAGRAVNVAGSALGVKAHSKTPSADITPATGEDGEARKREKKGLFPIRTGANDEASKSHASVFGGLVAGAHNLAGVATPGGTPLPPISRWESHPDTRSRSGSVEGSSTQGSPVVGRSALNTPPVTPGGTKRNPFNLNLKDLPAPGFKSHGHSPGASPRKELGEYFVRETEEEADRKAWEKEKRRRRKAKEKRKAHEVFITQHVAAILERQQFIMKLARAFMMFGAPSHRLEAQMQATARVLEINCQVIYIPGVMLISFGDAATHTSDIKFLKQANGLDLGKLLTAYMVYFNVIHDKISVTDASQQLDELMVAPPKYKLWQQLLIGAAAAAFIQPSAFYGSFIDCLMAMPLGALLVLVQVLVSRNDLYSSLFEIVIACVIAFLAAALASTKYFCFAAVVSGSIVLILPGYIVLCGSLELANRSIISGSVRLVYAILYSLFLGFGLSIGAEIYQRITNLDIAGFGGTNSYTCSSLRGDGVPWYMNTIPQWWYFLTIPMFLLTLAVRNGQPLFRKETLVMIVVGSAGFVSNFFSGKAFPNRADISSAIGSFAVGFLGNLYGKFTRGSPFVVMVPGVLIQLPSGLSNGGLLKFADDASDALSYTCQSDGAGGFTDCTQTTSDSTVWSSGFQTAESLVEVAIGLTVGLFVSAALVNVLGGGRRRGSNLSSF